MNTQKPKKEVKFPAKAVPMARLQKWQAVAQEVKQLEGQIQEMQRQLQEATTVLVGKRAVSEFLAKDLATEFDVGPKDTVDPETGLITKGEKA